VRLGYAEHVFELESIDSMRSIGVDGNVLEFFTAEGALTIAYGS
jgi:hypothetical protein